MTRSKIMIASTGSGRGKTTFTSAFLHLLKDRSVRAFKCGPDYIDPMFHKHVLGIESTNLDSFFCDEKLLNEVFEDNASDINIIESAMGLYDGMGTSSDYSAYDIASHLLCPIVLLVDGHGMGYSIVAEIKGFLSLDRLGLIRGIVLNRVSDSYYPKIAPVIERETGVKVYGHLPRIKGAELESRHLGLKSPEENDFSIKLDMICQKLSNTVDVDGIIELGKYTSSEKIKSEPKAKQNRIIAVAKDEAFTFIYEENLKVLKEAGYKINYFSPLHDNCVPDNVDTIILYGGYPENYAKDLSENKTMIESIRKACKNGIKIIAECGGFMYLLDSMTVADKSYQMAGIISGNSKKTEGLVRFGYVDIVHDRNTIKGHEFHHFEAYNVAYSDEYIIRHVSTDSKYTGLVVNNNIFAGFAHLYYRSCKKMILDFLESSQI